MTAGEFLLTVVPDAQGRVTKADRDTLLGHLRTLAHTRVDILIRPHKAQRTLGQNAWVWGIAYPLLAESLGYERDEIEDLHYGLMEKWGGTHWDARMRSMVPNKRSSKLSVGEFSDYIDWLVRFAATELNTVIPLPNETAGDNTERHA